MRLYTSMFAAGALALPACSARATQKVYLDFDTVGSATVHTYTMPERLAIKAKLESIFFSDPAGGPFGITFDFYDHASPPVSFSGSIVKFNDDLGHASFIDFRNLEHADDVSVNALATLLLYIDSAKSPAFGGGTWTEAELSSSPAIVTASANLAAHELGHALGLRHHDSFGPIGAGIGVKGDKYSPVYTGPTLMTNAEYHIMGLNSSVALNANTLLSKLWFSERSALKLTIDAIEGLPGPNPLVSLSEADALGGDAPDFGGAAVGFSLIPISVPNTTQPPDPFGNPPGDPTPPFPSLAGIAGIVTGSIEPRSDDEAPDVDWYSFTGTKGQRVTVEVIAGILGSSLNPSVELLDDFAFPLGYEGSLSLNNDQFESTDSILFDVPLPYTGKYLIEIASAAPLTTGEYQLLVYSVAVPEPRALAALAPLGLSMLRRRSHRRR